MAAVDEEKGKATTMTTEKEGFNLMGSPTFIDIENGRFRCVETGHELLEKDKESYSQSKRCRLGLIEYALSHKKPPLNLFKQDPNSRSKLICKLTGHSVNKSEEHIWKHINGKRFLNKLEEKEVEKESKKTSKENGIKEEKQKKQKKEKKKKQKKEKKKNEEDVGDDEAKDDDHDVGDDEAKDDDHDVGDDDGNKEESDFWMPPVGERWDFDYGNDRWGSDSELENEDGNETVNGEDNEEMSKKKKKKKKNKRKSEELNPSGIEKKKKKKKKKVKVDPSLQL